MTDQIDQTVPEPVKIADMALSAQAVEVYKITLGSTYLGYFEIVSTWEGMRKLGEIGGEGTLIVGPSPAVSRFMSQIFGMEYECQLLGISPSLAAKVMAADKSMSVSN